MLPTLHVFNSCVAFTHFSQLSICECRIIFFFFLSFVNRMGYLLMHTTPLAANQIKIVICLLFGTATVRWHLLCFSHWVNGRRTFFFGHDVCGMAQWPWLEYAMPFKCIFYFNAKFIYPFCCWSVQWVRMCVCECVCVVACQQWFINDVWSVSR